MAITRWDTFRDVVALQNRMNSLFQDFSVRCRMQRLLRPGIDLPAFRRRFAVAVAGPLPAEQATAMLRSRMNIVVR